MFGQPSQMITIDFWTLIPSVLRRIKNGQSSGQFTVRNQEIACLRRSNITSTSTGSYYADFCWPSDERDLSTGTLILVREKWDEPKILLLVGRPNGFSEYQWQGVCPKTLKREQMLYLDPGTQLFVAREAIGKTPPESVKRICDLQVVMGKFIEKYGLTLQPNVDLSEDPDFFPLKGLFDIMLDAFFAINGLPSPVLTATGNISVLATIHDPRERRRLPARLLKKNTARKVPRTFGTVEEVRAEFKRRQLPDPGEQFFRAIERRFRGS